MDRTTMFGKRKGISTFIATLLLMVLAVSAGVVIYAYTMGYMGGFGGTDTLGAMSLDEVSMIAGGVGTGKVTAYIRNIGKTDLEIVTAYVNGEVCDVEVGTTATTDDVIVEGTSSDVHVTLKTGSTNVWAAGKTYDIKLICEDNTQLSFSVKCKTS